MEVEQNDSASAAEQQIQQQQSSISSVTCSECPLSEEPQNERISPCMVLFDCSTTCSSSSSSASSSASTKSKCKECRQCRREEEIEVEEDSMQKQQQSMEIWPTRPDAKWKVRTVGLLAALLPGWFLAGRFYINWQLGIGCYFCLAFSFAFQFERIYNFTIPSTFCPVCCPKQYNTISMFLGTSKYVSSSQLQVLCLPQTKKLYVYSFSIGVWKPQKYIWLMVCGF